jgi:hypothetical protein
LNDLLNTAFFPEPPKDQVWSDPLYRDSLSLSGGMCIDNGKLFAMTQSRAYQRLKLSAGLELIEPAQSPKDLLAHLLALTDAMDDLEILVGTGPFDSEKHCSRS